MEDKTSVFGFSTAPSNGGDFTPIIQYDARSGRMFRRDRVDNGQGWENEQVDITAIFKAICDFENIEVGWIVFTPGGAPDFRMVPLGNQMPDKPSPNHKNGLRFMLKLSKECGGDKPIREIAGTSKAFLSGIEAVYLQYSGEKGKYPGKLPVLTLEKTSPVKSGSGQQSSTNYHPTFKISGWAPRGDLLFTPKAAPTVMNGSTPPSTGSTPAPTPTVSEAADNDFG